MPAQFGHAHLRRRRHCEEWRLRIGPVGQQSGHFEPRLHQALRRHPVGLVQRHHQLRHSQQGQDVQVLTRLRHRPVVGRHHQQAQVNAGHTGQHGAHQALVARDVDKTDGLARRCGIGPSAIA